MGKVQGKTQEELKAFLGDGNETGVWRGLRRAIRRLDMQRRYENW